MPAPRLKTMSVWLGMSPPVRRGPVKDARLGPCEAKITKPERKPRARSRP